MRGRAALAQVGGQRPGLVEDGEVASSASAAAEQIAAAAPTGPERLGHLRLLCLLLATGLRDGHAVALAGPPTRVSYNTLKGPAARMEGRVSDDVVAAGAGAAPTTPTRLEYETYIAQDGSTTLVMKKRRQRCRRNEVRRSALT